MKIACVGGGPAGLYLSILLKLRDSGNEVTLYERSRSGSRSGWGVTFGPGLLAELYRQDPGTARQLEAAAEIRWQGTVVWHRGERHAEPGDPNFVVHSISRRQMIDIFTSRAEALGVNFEYGVSVTSPAELPWADVIVAADGVKSQLRSSVEGLGTRIATRTSKYIWLGSTTVYRPLTYLFVESAHGWLCGHTYGIDSATSAFFVECAEQTWTGLGFDRMSISEALPVLYNLFSEYLDGGQLLGTLPDGSDARWQNFTTVRNQHWRSGNVVLIGDAAHTNYPSTGMGTTLAFQDGVCLADALHSGRDIPSALESYERQRKRAMLRPTIDAAVNARWFNNALRNADFLSPVQLATLLFARSSPLLGILPPRLAYRLKQSSKRVPFLAAIRDLSWRNLVRKSDGAVDGVEDLAEVVEEGAGGGDGLLPGFDLDLAVAAGRLDELPDRPAGLRLNPAADGEGCEHDRQVGLDRVALVPAERPPRHCARQHGTVN